MANKVKRLKVNPDSIRQACKEAGGTQADISRQMGFNPDYVGDMIANGRAPLSSIRLFCSVTGASEDKILVKENKPAFTQPAPSRQLDIFAGSELTDEQIERIADRVAAILAARLTGAPQAQYERDALDAMTELAEGGRVS